MNSLPNELLIQIASHLDTEPPSITKFAYEPTSELTCSNFTPLKFLSCASWRWRKIVLPILFRYTRISLDTEPQWVPIDARLVDSMQGQLTKLSNHEYQVYEKMRSKFKSSPTFAYDEAFDDILRNIVRIQDGDDFLKSAPNILWFPHLEKSFAKFGDFIAQYTLKHHIKSIVIHTDKEYELRRIAAVTAPLDRAVAEIWSQIFAQLEPTRVVVAAPPTTFEGLLDTEMYSSDTWAFDMKMHYIELRQQEPLRLDHMTTECRPWNSALIHRRPWYHLGYNEGSSIAAYNTYEYHLKLAPMMLYLILVRLAKEARSCCNITSFSFTGIFPFATHLTTIIRALSRIPTLKNISVQFTPGPENNLLNDPKRVGRAQSSDYWLEWSECYKVIASYLGAFGFEDGAKFRTEDCGSLELVNDVGEYMDLLRKRGVGWRKEGAGVWIRDHGLDREVTMDDILVG
ncbi:hypothetical protein BKA66DRAFT_467376 [Pyrenochaeta sp. MPI-SDFR-AT-0127]|nr:hypothetical protein BKA66DRAFT_467376 [Pyrenochaeta sp. MPI-SDFR-AT-0127]